MKMYLKSGPVLIKILGEDKILESLNCKFLFDYIPGVSLLGSSKIFDGELKLKISGKNEFSYSLENNSAQIIFNPKKISKEDLITLIEHTFENLRQSKGVYCLHGSAISINGKGVLLMGSVSGLGKTSLALNLCLAGKAKFIGDEKILVNVRGEILAGVKNLNFNKEVLAIFLPKKLDSLSSSELGRVVDLENEKVPLRLVVTPVLINGEVSLEAERWNTAKSAFHFYEELSRKIRGISRRVGNYSIPVGSADTGEISEKRSKFCNQSVKNIEFWLLKGSQKEVSEKILSIINSYA